MIAMPATGSGSRIDREPFFILLLCIVCHVLACHPAPAPRAGPGVEPPRAQPVDGPQRSELWPSASLEEPRSQEPIRTDLAVEGAFPLLTWAPEGSEPKPLVISAHGAGCLAEQHCEYFWRLLEGRAIVACLRGEPLYRNRPEQGFYFRDHLALARELEGAVTALRAHFGARLLQGWTYAGYSQGATMGALLLPDSPASFTQVLLIEGGGEGMSRTNAEKLRAKGTARVLFACGTTGCRDRSARVADVLGKVGIDARVAFGEGAGHTYLGSVETTVLAQASWLWPGMMNGK
jgi:predicted esterase